MKIVSITNLEPGERAEVKPSTVKKPTLKYHSTEILEMCALKKALKEQPDVRFDMIEEFKAKTDSLAYPPAEIIQGISRLIAERLIELRRSDSEWELWITHGNPIVK